MQKKIIVIRGGAIGDFVLTLPVISALKERFTQSRIAVMGYPHIVQLALLGGLADEIRSIDSRSLAPFFIPGGNLPLDMVGFFSDAAIVISYLYDPDEIFQENVLRCFNGVFISGPYKPSETSGIHATETFLKPLEQLAIFSPNSTPKIKIPSDENERHDKFWLAVHPGSGSETKNWPLPKWKDLINKLMELEQVKILLVGGEAEGDRLDLIASVIPEKKIELARSLPLKELALRMNKCDAFIGHDSGITHLAAALGLQGIALWGTSSLDIWKLRSEIFKVIKYPGGISNISIDEVFNELKSIITQ